MDHKVNQPYFNEVVMDNIALLEMEHQEAIDSAVSQLTAQGVNLHNVIFDIKVVFGIDAISTFHKLYNNVRVFDDVLLEAFLPSMDIASTLADTNLKYKLFAGTKDVHKIILKLLKDRMDDPLIVKRILPNLIKIVSGYPDLVDESSILFLVDLFYKYVPDNCIMLLTANLILKSLTKHENNKQRFFQCDRSRPMIRTLIESNDDDCVKIGCDLITTICQDDDIRVEISTAHTRATSFAEDFISQCYTKLKSRHRVDLTSDVMKAVTSMAVTAQLVSDIFKLDSEFEMLINLLQNFPKEVVILHNVNKLLVALSGHDDCKSAMGKLIPLIVKELDENMVSHKVIQSTLLVISSLSLRSKPNALAFLELNAVDKIVQAMKVHKQVKVRRYGCMALRNIGSSSKASFDDTCVVDLMNSFLENDSLVEECKSVLIALGAPVNLTERWTGKRGDVVGENEKKLLDR